MTGGFEASVRAKPGLSMRPKWRSYQTANEDLVLLAATVEGAGVSLQPLYSAAPLIAAGSLLAAARNDLAPFTLAVKQAASLCAREG